MSICLLLFVQSAIAGENLRETALMPVPERITFNGQDFRIDTSFRIAIGWNTDPRLRAGATRMLRRLCGRTGLFLSPDFVAPDDSMNLSALVIITKRSGVVELGEDESYELEVSGTGIRLSAENDLGALHGLETLLQLLSSDSRGYFVPGVTVEDKPRFPWRGLMIDAARHFMPPDVIKRNLDGMAAVKMNVFHWHLCDDQGFRVESRAWPKLHEAASDGMYYTQSQIKEIVEYAAERGIRVVPEFDVPGHATAFVAAYPELSSAPGKFEVERKWGVFFPVLNPANEFTYRFLDTLVGEMAGLFPDPFFHIGGDEIEHPGHKAEHWDDNPEIQEFKKQHNIHDNGALQGYFNNRLLAILTKHKKILVGWDEILHESMPTNVVIQSWRGRASMERAARQGYRSILSNGYYIDLIQPTDFHYFTDPLPIDVQLSEEQKRAVLGGETTMWSEYVSSETIDSRIWPRAAAIAERLWSPRSVNDVEDMYRRLERISLQLEELGLTHEKNYDMMLRRLVMGNDIAALKTLVDVLEPVKGYTRGRLKPHTSFSPLTRVVDAARPDAAVARRFRVAVDRFLSGKGNVSIPGDDISVWLRRWEGNHRLLAPIIRRSPVLEEITPMSEGLSNVAALGLDALAYLQKKEPPSNKWKNEATGVLEKAKQPGGQTEMMIIPAIEKLVAAASSVSP